MSFRARCVICEWIADKPSNSVVMCGHYAMKHVKEKHPDVEGIVAVIERLRR